MGNMHKPHYSRQHKMTFRSHLIVPNMMHFHAKQDINPGTTSRKKKKHFNTSGAYWIVQKIQNIAQCEEHYDMGIIKNVFWD